MFSHQVRVECLECLLILSGSLNPIEYFTLTNKLSELACQTVAGRRFWFLLSRGFGNFKLQIAKEGVILGKKFIEKKVLKGILKWSAIFYMKKGPFLTMKIMVKN